jgi:alkanesulfonate monooxygenase SsuD/methylene tetrahydromethanopterin reductase-like flavin-dependent oxidoreductase (luciferase family)
MPMRFGLALPQYDWSLPELHRIDWPVVRDWAQRGEDLGFDSVWLSDHLFMDLTRYGGPDGPQGTMECLSTLAALSATTRRVRLGSLVVCNDLRSPSLLAKMVATLDVLSGGRVEVGMGAGWYEPDFTAAGIPFERAGVRIERLAEAVQIVVGMLSEEAFSFQGAHYRVEQAWNLPRPVQSPRPAVWVGGRGNRVLSVAARHADGFNTCWQWTPEGYRERMEVLNRECLRVGRSPGELRRSVGLYALPGSDPTEVAGRWERYLSANPWLQPPPRLEDWRSDKLCGTPEEIAVRVGAFEAVGAEEVILSFGLLPFQVADASAVEFFAREVFPLIGQRS